MTMHETLNFVRELHNWIERQVENKGPWCWPEWNLLGANLRMNRQHFGGNLKTWQTHIRRAESYQWVEIGPCSAHCHGRHVKLTALGDDVLAHLDSGARLTPTSRRIGRTTFEEVARPFQFVRKAA